MAGVHEDFGEKIGGAKKDLWKDRGLYADDLEAMNEREAEKFVKKDNVWKKPVSYTHLDVYKRQGEYPAGMLPLWVK